MKKAESNHNFADRDKVLLVIAEHPATDDIILERLSLIKNSSDLHIRKNIAENPNTPEVVLEELANSLRVTPAV